MIRICTTSTSGASEISSEIQQLRSEREHSTVQLGSRNDKMSKRSSVEAQAAQILRLRGMIEVERKIEYSTGR